MHFSRLIDDFVADFLASSDVASPPVDAIQLALFHGFTVAYDEGQSTRARSKRLGQGVAIFLKPDPRCERVQWAAAHELGEALFPGLADFLGLEYQDVLPEQREELANEFARRLLLPTALFQHVDHETDGDLLELKRHFTTCSHELIAMRWLDFDTPEVITVIDQGIPSRRRSTTYRMSARLTPIEQTCWREVASAGNSCELRHHGFRVRGWPIHEPDWRREILRLELPEFSDETFHEELQECL